MSTYLREAIVIFSIGYLVSIYTYRRDLFLNYLIHNKALEGQLLCKKKTFIYVSTWMEWILIYELLFWYVFDTYDLFSEVNLNATCSAGQPLDQCSDSKSECTSSMRCYCQNGYFENSGNVCSKSKSYQHDLVSK